VANNQVQSTVALIETYYWKYRRLPKTDEELYSEYLVETCLEEVLAEGKYCRYLSSHGIPVDGTPTLSPKAVRWIDTLCSAGDTRPLSVKAKDSGVSMSQHNAWLKNPLFQNALTSRLESILPDERNRVHTALAREASGGNVAAIKLYLQVTGEITEGQSADKGEAASLMQGILEILETHVDRNVLSALANDFDYLLVHGTPPERKRVRVGVVPEKPRNVLELVLNDDDIS
jgi:Helix-turn-helix of insertion element transposase